MGLVGSVCTASRLRFDPSSNALQAREYSLTVITFIRLLKLTGNTAILENRITDESLEFDIPMISRMGGSPGQCEWILQLHFEPTLLAFAPTASIQFVTTQNSTVRMFADRATLCRRTGSLSLGFRTIDQTCMTLRTLQAGDSLPSI